MLNVQELLDSQDFHVIHVFDHRRSIDFLPISERTSLGPDLVEIPPLKPNISSCQCQMMMMMKETYHLDVAVMMPQFAFPHNLSRKQKEVGEADQNPGTEKRCLFSWSDVGWLEGTPEALQLPGPLSISPELQKVAGVNHRFGLIP